MDLKAALPMLLPRAVEWAKVVADAVQQNGVTLNASGLELARAVGVSQPERIRLAIVPEMPVPSDPELQQAAVATGLLGPGNFGLTLGYSVIVKHGYQSPRTLSHEFRHVHQYEAGGGIEAMVPVYLGQIVEYGYLDSPMEIDARAHERNG